MIISLLERLERWQIVGLLDREFGATEEDIGGYKIIGSWKDIENGPVMRSSQWGITRNEKGCITHLGKPRLSFQR